MPTVSVVIPTFNRAHLLQQTLDSVFSQTYKDYEVIVVDDGSTDATADLIAAYRPEVCSLRQVNRGLNSARNAAIERTRGRYIALLDSDDLWLPYTLELFVQLLERFPDSGFVYSNFYIFRDGSPLQPQGLSTWHGGRSSPDSTFQTRYEFGQLGIPAPRDLRHGDFCVYQGDIYLASLAEPQVLPSASLYRRDCAEGLHFTESDSTCGDWEFFARLSKRSGAVYADTEAAINRSHDDAVRLTRLPATIQLSRRINMINRVWRADGALMERMGFAVNDEQARLLLQLARIQLAEGADAEARSSLNEAAELSPRFRNRERRLLSVASHIPGSGRVMRKLIRLVRHWAG